MQRIGVALALVLGGCTMPTPTPTGQASAALGMARTVYLAFGGAALTVAATDDAPAAQSALLIDDATVPPLSTASAPRVSAQVAQASIIDRVRGYLAPFNVTVVTSPPPATTDYTLVAIGGDGSTVNGPAGTAGMAQLDCTAANADHVDFDFAAAQTPDEGGVVSVAVAAAHELGHSWGLEHTSAPLDLMYVVEQPTRTLPQMFQLGYVGGMLSGYAGGEGVPAQPACGHPNPVDEATVLDGVLGAATRTGDTTPPTVSFTLDGTQLTADASDDTGVVRVEIYVDLELQAAPTAPPYSASLVLPASAASDGYFVTVEAVDAAANRATQTRYIAPASSDGGSSGDRSDLGATDAGASPPPRATSSGHGQGCAFGLHTSAPMGARGGWAFLALVLLASRLVRRRRPRRLSAVVR